MRGRSLVDTSAQRGRRGLALGIATLSVAATVVGFTQGPAQAATAKAYHGSDYSYGNGATRIWVHDKEADNHGVYAEYWTRGGHKYTVGDPNGSREGSGTELSEDGTVIDSYRTCEETQGCGAWVE